MYGTPEDLISGLVYWHHRNSHDPIKERFALMQAEIDSLKLSLPAAKNTELEFWNHIKWHAAGGENCPDDMVVHGAEDTPSPALIHNTCAAWEDMKKRDVKDPWVAMSKSTMKEKTDEAYERGRACGGRIAREKAENSKNVCAKQYAGRDYFVRGLTSEQAFDVNLMANAAHSSGRSEGEAPWTGCR